MPNLAHHPNVIKKGKRPGSKHRTKAEVESALRAADALRQKTPVTLTAPEWLNPVARKIWKRKVDEIAALQSPDALLSNLDSDVLAVLCDNIASYMDLAKHNGKTTIEEHKVKQTYTMRIIGAADKLGFTPASRARLIRKKAEEEPGKEKFGKDFD